MLRKINDCESLEISQENVYDGVFLVVCLQCPDCNSSIKRIHHRFFPQYVSKSSCLQNNILRKKSIMENVLIKCRPCSTNPAILSKTELNRAYVYFLNSLEFISCNLIKKELHHKDSCEISLPSVF